MKKYVSQLFTAILAATAIGFADDGCYQDCGWECRYPSAYSLNCFQGFCCDLRISGAILYWELSDAPYEFLIEKKSVRNAATETPDMLLSSKECCKGVGFGYDPGFRIGIGTSLPCFCECLEVDFYWTHYYVHGKEHICVKGLGDPVYHSFTLISTPEITGEVDSGKSCDFFGKAKFRYDVLDLEFGKWCCLCDCLRFRPFFGLRYVDIEDETCVDFSFSGQIQGCEFLSGRVKTSNDFRGLGIRGGFGLEYDCFCCLSLYANIAGSFAWGKAHSSIGCNAIAGQEDPTTRSHCGGDNGRAFLDGEIGIQYSTCICGCYPILLDLAWEQNYLFNMRRCPTQTGILSLYETSKGSCGSEDLILSGLTFTVELEF